MTDRSQFSTVAVFGGGALVAVVAYAIASVYIFDLHEVRWGRGGSFQVVLLLGFVIATVSTIAFGAALGLTCSGFETTIPARGLPFALGVVVMGAGTGLALLSQRWLGASLLWVASSFIVCSLVAGVLFGQLAKRGARAAG